MCLHLVLPDLTEFELFYQRPKVYNIYKLVNKDVVLINI